MVERCGDEELLCVAEAFLFSFGRHIIMTARKGFNLQDETVSWQQQTAENERKIAAAQEPFVIHQALRQSGSKE